MTNNDLLYNAALAGVAGGTGERWFQVYAASLPTLIEQIAVAIDADIAPIVGGANDSQAALLQSIATGVFSSRYPEASISSYVQIATMISSIFNQLNAKLVAVTPVTSGGLHAFPFTFATGALSIVQALQANTVVSSISVLVTTPFNGGMPLMDVGTPLAPSAFVSNSSINLKVAGQYDNPAIVPNSVLQNMIMTFAGDGSTAGGGVLFYMVSTT
jgi:hypothetical protein